VGFEAITPTIFIWCAVKMAENPIDLHWKSNVRHIKGPKCQWHSWY